MELNEAISTGPPPEVVFDRHFRNKISLEEQKVYQRKVDLDLIEHEPTRLLLHDVQIAINKAYAAQRFRIASQEYLRGIHFDYIQSPIPNAIAFQDEGIAFVGFTIPMLDSIGAVCKLLADAPQIAGLFRPGEVTAHERNQLFTALFGLQQQFVACHELGHHFHGHTCGEAASAAPWQEFADNSGQGNLRKQAGERDADGFAAHMMLRNCIAGVPRGKFLELLGQPERSPDDLLLSALIIAAGSFFFFRERPFDAESIEELTHPLAAARVHFIVEEIAAWLEEHRPASAAFVTLERFHALMKAVAEALRPQTSGEQWDIQTDFLLSPRGREYLEAVAYHRAVLRDDMADLRWELAP